MQSKNSEPQSSNPEVQFFQITRSFAVRYLAYLREKSSQPQTVDELEVTVTKILNCNETKQVILSKLLSLQLRGDYHQVIALTLMQDLAKWSREFYSQIESDPQYKPLLQAIIEQSTKLLNSQQQFHTIVPKQNDLLRELLITPQIVTHSSLEGFRAFYRKLKDVKEFYPQTVKEHQKIVFLKTVEESIEVCAKFQALKTFDFIFQNVFAELEVLESGHEFVTSRLKLVKKIVKHLWFFHEDILYKSAFLVMKFSYQVLTLPHLFCSVLNLYEDLLPILIKKISPAPLIIFNHLIMNNIQKLLQLKTSSPLLLQTLLNGLTQIFRSPFIEYFMKNYEANFMQESICQSALNLLFEFVENRMNQKKAEYDIFRRYLKKATDSIRCYLNQQQPHITQPSQKLQKFYEVKRKQYLEIVQDMNQKPKKIFKKLESISNKEIREEIMKKYSRIAKHSTHLDMKKMIDLFAANNSTSEELFGEYVNLLFSNLSKDVNLEEFLRFFSSNFFLNGESQQILRVLDKITVLFYNHQPLNNKILKNSDSTYTFANAIILLNSDLHNPQNEEKMSLESFYKICKHINAGSDLPTETLTQTYTNIKKNKINTFRSKSQMQGISPSNFVLICNKQQQNKLDFYDLEMRMLTNENFYDFWVFDLLAGIIDERQTMKLEQLIERFVYDDNAYECEVIQLIRKLAKKKPHIPLHALEKILEHANFKNSKTSEKTISYLWLAVNLVQTFSSYLPTNVICQLLIFTWRVRSEIKDDMYLREKAEIKRIRKMVRELQKRQSKKSIMDMFSSFLSSKEEDSEPDLIEEFSMSQTNIKKMNHKVLTEKVMEVLAKTGDGLKPRHRVKAIEFFIGYLRNDEQKIFEEFLSLLYMIFHLLYRFEISKKVVQKNREENQSPVQLSNPQASSQSPHKKNLLSSSLNLSTQLKLSQQSSSSSQFEQTIEDLFYQLLGLKESSITKRIQNLKKKDVKKYEILQSYCHYWVLKILISKIELSESVNKENSERMTQVEGKQNNQLYLLNKSIEYLEKTDKEIYLDLVYEFQAKAKQAFSVSSYHQSSSSNKNIKDEESTKQTEDNKQQELIRSKSEQVLGTEALQQVQMSKNLSLKEPDRISPTTQSHPTQKPQQKQPQLSLIQAPPNTQSSTSHQLHEPSPFSQQSEQIIQNFIFTYRKLILEFYVNCIRVIGKEEMKKKDWRWLVELEKMIKQVMENYQEKTLKHQSRESQENNPITEKKKVTQQNKQNQDQTTSQLSEVQPTNKIHPQESNNETEKTENNIAIEQSNQENEQIRNSHQPQNVEAQNKIPSQQQRTQTEKEQEQLIERINRQLSQPQENNQSDSSTNKQQTVIQSKSAEKQLVNPVSSSKQSKPENKMESSQNTQNQIEKAQSLPSHQVASQQNAYIKNSCSIEEKQANLIKQEEEAIKKLMEMYPAGCESSEMLGMPFYML